MVRIARDTLCVTLLAIAALAQLPKERGLLLPSPVHFVGVVRDADGKPLSGVYVDHLDSGYRNVKTDSDGRFDISTRAPAIVFRRWGYQSRYWRVAPNQNLVIVLTGPAQQMRQCAPLSMSVGLKGWRQVSTFRLPPVRGVHVGKQVNDADYGARWFWISTGLGKIGVQLGAGFQWSSGLPFNEDVWSATEYSEQSYRDSEGFGIIDARGKSKDGKCWRVLGHAFETASYRNIREGETRQLDRLLDGVCTVHRPKPK